jgi:hypothetical protein
MWTDMSEIVRPTRDGIHGREFISTSVDIGQKPPFLTFDERGGTTRGVRTFSLPIPFFFDAPPASVLSRKFLEILVEAAREAGTLVALPAKVLSQFAFQGQHIVPLLGREDAQALPKLGFTPRMIELEGGNEARLEEARARFPEATICLRYELASKEELLRHYRSGFRVFHVVANYHGRGKDGRFVLELIREAHKAFVEASCRDEVTLLGSGGIIAAEHVPKAIICGLDAVALDTPLLAALQARFVEECAEREQSRFKLPRRLTVDWGVQRLKNFLTSWRDQLLEVLGAMGLREVRRLRGEMGRAMFQKELEREAFSGIEGYGK